MRRGPHRFGMRLPSCQESKCHANGRFLTTSYAPGQKVLYLGRKFCMRVEGFITRVDSFIPG
jgi:hypothetical protein